MVELARQLRPGCPTRPQMGQGVGRGRGRLSARRGVTGQASSVAATPESLIQSGMCGKFTAKASWTEVVDYIWSTAPIDGGDDRTYRVMNELPVIVLEGEERRGVPMRW